MIETTWLIELATRGSLVLLLASLATACLRSAAWRHLVWSTALVGLLLLPLLMGGVPSIAVPVLPAAEAVSSETVQRATRPAGAPLATIPPLSIAAATSESPISAQRTGSASTGLSLLDGWWIAAALLVSMMGADRLRRARLTRRARPLGTPAWLRDLERLRDGGRSVRLLISADVDVPVTWGLLRPVLLLPAGSESWGGSLRRHVLLHELAHIERADAAILGLARIACALHWFNPLAWWALRRLVREAELAADDRVLIAGARPSSYAGDLVDFARGLRRSLPRAAVAMARRGSPLQARITAILDQDRLRAVPRPSRVALALALAGLVVLPVAAALRPERREAPRIGMVSAVAGPVSAARPAVEAQPTSTPTPAPAPRSSRSGRWQGIAADCGESRGASIRTDDDRLVMEVRSKHCELSIETEGTIEYSDDDSGVVRMGSGARLEIDERRGGVRRRLIATPGPGGAPQYRYTVDRETRPFDDEGRNWLTQVLPEVFRATGLNAERRVGRILAADGAQGVLAEIELIRSDYVGRLYLGHLLDQGDLDSAELRSWLELAGRQIGSDYELAETLISLPLTRLTEPGIGEAFVGAASTIGSDYELRRTLGKILEAGSPTAATLDRILETASTIGSDYELAELLIRVAGVYPHGESLPGSYHRAADSIGSDYELRRTLSKALERPLAADALVDLLKTARSIGSDYELAELLVTVGRTQRIDNEAREAFLAALDTVGSDYEHRRAADVLARQGH